MWYIFNLFLQVWVAKALNTAELSTLVNFTVLEENNNICLTTECVKTAQRLLQNMNTSVDPCDNFYEFACESYVKNTRIPDEMSSIDPFAVMEEETREKYRSLLEASVSLDDIRPYRIAKNFYTACMDTTDIDSQGVEPILRMIKRVGGWPLLDGADWDTRNLTWIDIIYRFREVGFEFDQFFELDVHEDFRNASIYIVDVVEAKTYMANPNDSNYNDTKKMYKSFLLSIAKALGANESSADHDLQKVVDFEDELVKIDLLVIENAAPKPTTIAELKKAVPKIPWFDLINRLLKPITSIGFNDTIYTTSNSYFLKLQDLLERTPSRVLVNYAFARALKLSSHYVKSVDIEKALDLLHTFETGIMEKTTRWRKCVDITYELLSTAVDAMYLKKYLNKDTKHNIESMVKLIRSQFYNYLSKTDWIDNITRIDALKKADALRSYIAYTEEFIDDNIVTNYYNNLKTSKKMYLESYLNISIFTTNKKFQLLLNNNNKETWADRKVTEVNALYSFAQNEIYLAAGILQGPIYSVHRPAFVNFASIGFFIAHEVCHAFDSTGRLYDKDGNIKDWWQSSTIKQYLRKAQCIQDQYSKYKVKEAGNRQLNGQLTLGENIADNIGLQIAYQAYQSWVKINGQEQSLPGLHNYTENQVFWIAVAAPWCLAVRETWAKQLINIDPHSPPEYRIIGAMSNLNEFAKDFNCPLGSPMHPKHKCTF